MWNNFITIVSFLRYDMTNMKHPQLLNASKASDGYYE